MFDLPAVMDEFYEFSDRNISGQIGQIVLVAAVWQLLDYEPTLGSGLPGARLALGGEHAYRDRAHYDAMSETDFGPSQGLLF